MYALWRTWTVNKTQAASAWLLRLVACAMAVLSAADSPVSAEPGRRATLFRSSEPFVLSSRPHTHRRTLVNQTSPRPDNRTLTFDATCAPGQRAVIAAVGDLLFHDALQVQALRPGQSFRSFWAPLAPLLADADLTYGNLESPIAAGVGPGGAVRKDPGRVLDGVVYGRRSTELVFNTHPSVAADLVASGFDVVSTANNHSADRGALGMDRSLDALAAAGLAQTGLRRSRATSETESPSPWSVQTRTANGVTVAWLACTYGLNGMRDPHNQVLHCYRDLDVVTAELRALAADPSIDAVVLTPHWGIEGATAPQAADRGLARHAIDQGAIAVIGTHPHVLQPWEKHVTPDGREGLIVYSTGNFISNQKSDEQRTGIVALLEITKPQAGGRARLSAAGFVPTFVQMSGDSGHRVTELATASDATRRLPAGNRVTMARFRDLPRACRPAEPDAAPPPPDVIAVLQLPPLADVADPSALSSATQAPIDSATIDTRSLAPTTSATNPADVAAAAPAAPVALSEPADHRAPVPSRGTTRGSLHDVAAHAGEPFPPRRTPPPSRQDPLRAGRLRLDRLSDTRLASLDPGPTFRSATGHF
jgi:poly-gamma-glutamate capsule biosynthesis protein CapA/YwtB (metallophosphatase superfamily)